MADSGLSALTIGNLTLDPTFDPAVTEYAVSTSNATNKVTATASDNGATVAITLNGAAMENGSSASWNTGENVLIVTVTNGSASTAYTITVTKS